MANPAHRSILLDHQMIVDGVLIRERKYLTKILNDETGVEESHLIHTRRIGEKIYTSKQSIIDGEKEMIETDLNNFELVNFMIEWEEKWNPSIREDEHGIHTRFFKIFNLFAYYSGYSTVVFNEVNYVAGHDINLISGIIIIGYSI